MSENTVSSRRIYDGRVVRLRVDSVRLPDGREAVREVVEHSGAVAVVPLTDDGRVVLVRQWRHPASSSLLEIPAGTLEPGEDAADCAARELIEETNRKASSVRPLMQAWLAPGYSTEFMHFFVATGLTECQGQQDEDEDVSVELYPLTQIPGLISSGRIDDVKTIAGLLMACRF